MTEPAYSASPSDQPVARHGAASGTGATAWLRVSPKYAWVDLVGNLIPVVIAGGAAYVIPTYIRSDVPVLVVIALAVVAVAFLVNAILAFRRVRAMGYALREDDLVFRRGIMFERVVAVPYGRLQLVDVTRGPLLRALGLANLKFVTAAAATGIALPGLVDADAEALRDELIRLAESRRSGL
ncbi:MULTISPECIES: PH domain-containing protein [unclassified Leucobacter]|uniref:PH domain-containing protein n=1 Tax=unclassified Leucobacter TaxID=2621730 RepID=UPI0018EBF48B